MALLAILKPKFEPGERLLKKDSSSFFLSPSSSALGLATEAEQPDGRFPLITSWSPSIPFAAQLLLSPAREPHRRRLRRNFPIDRLAPQDREGDARHLVGKRYGDKLEGLLLDQFLRHIRSGSV